MSQPTEHERFTDVMTTLASQDSRVRIFARFLLTGNDGVVTGTFFDNYMDNAGFATEIGRYYAIDSEGVRQAFLRCFDELGIERVDIYEED